MYLMIIPSLLLAFLLQATEYKFEQLIGTWQLVHFDAIDQLRKSPEYQNANSAMRQGIEYKIQNRLENTVYMFVEGDSLKYTDYVNHEVVQLKAKIGLSSDDILTFTTASEIRQAKIVALDSNRLVLEPISTKVGSGKLTFERTK
ncbi:hypothetical protein [Algoriphagus sp. AGSA1]|uniref:hypothetical protein n=1 Tax=Algoriphagus sp. AGSA1 TaxID=2907213 RepID=UPI001F31E8BB|nr:hypothetical protein [Algoriphagus sp. AGSA1]